MYSGSDITERCVLKSFTKSSVHYQHYYWECTVLLILHCCLLLLVTLHTIEWCILLLVTLQTIQTVQYTVHHCTVYFAVHVTALYTVLCCISVECCYWVVTRPCPSLSFLLSSQWHFSHTLQCSAVQCSAVQCSAVQCSAVQCGAVQCSAGRR